MACVAAKPIVDGIEKELTGRLVVVRVDVQSDQGRYLANKYGILGTPTFIFFNASGKETFRSIGAVDADRIRAELP